MAWQNFQNFQHGRLYQESTNPRKFCVNTVCGVDLHYESEKDSLVYDAPVDFRREYRNNLQMDGWRAVQGGWHYALGVDKLTTMFDPAAVNSSIENDGIVGFGGRQGQNWFKFRLEKVGKVHWPTRSYEDIGGNPTYERGNLSREDHHIVLPTLQETIHHATKATWSNLWSTPGGGQVDAIWGATSNDLKEWIRLNQAGRSWLEANHTPASPTDTYLSWLFRVDLTDIPKRRVDGVLKSLDEDFEGDTELLDAENRLLAFLPLDYVYVDLGGGQIVKEPLRKRFWQDAQGRHWLAVGLRWDKFQDLPVGDLWFDPTITPDVAASADDGFEQASNVNYSLPVLKIESDDASIQAFWGFARFQCTGPAAGDTVDEFYAEIYIYSTTDDINCDIHCEDVSSAADLSTTNDIDGRTRTSASTAMVSDGVGTGWLGSAYSAQGAAAEVIGSGGPWGGSGSYLGVIWAPNTDVDKECWARSYDYDVHQYAPKATLEYTAAGAGGGLYMVKRNLNGLGAGGPFFNNPLG